MDGLEAVEVRSNEIHRLPTFRIDSDYYKRKYIEQEHFIRNNKTLFTTFKELKLGVSASAFYPALETYYGTGEIPFIRVADIKNNINYENCTTIPEMGHDFNTLHKCSAGDLVLTKGGSVGKVGLIRKDSYVTRDLIFINASTLNRDGYIALFLLFKTNFMYDLMIRSSSLSVQPHLTTSLIREFPIFVLSDNFKKRLLNLYEIYEYTSYRSKRLYQSAENLLLSHLGLDNFNPNPSNIAVKSFQDSFGSSGRLDSEYYQPKYEELESYISANETVASSCVLHDADFPPNDKLEYKYIELSNIGKDGEITDVKIEIGNELPTRARRRVKKGQVIVSSIEGSLRNCALINDEYDNALCSTGFYVVSSNAINPETLLTVFKSSPIQALMKKRCSGTILIAMNKDEFMSLPIPSIDQNIQLKIAQKVQESFALRKKSAQLLELAKTAVEMAIEQGEEKAMAMIKELNLPDLK